VKTLVTAVDAATAENPSGKRVEPRNGQSSRAANTPSIASGTGTATGVRMPSVPDPARKAAQTAVRTVVQARETQRGLKHGSRRFGEAVWRPFVRLSGVLWLEVAGVFFGVFALVALSWGWKVRSAWHLTGENAADHRRLLSAIVMLALFGYFCVSSFVRARRRERQR
jgi:hypothetical protein